MNMKTLGQFEIGAELPPLIKTIQQRQIDCYSGVRPNSIHTDPEWARSKGFRAPLPAFFEARANLAALRKMLAV